MAATKGDYESMGERAARTNMGSLKLAEVRPTTLRPGSWQCRHWDIGFERAERQRKHQNLPLPVGEPKGPLYHNSVTGVISSRPQSDISKLRVINIPVLMAHADLKDWPQATREHVRLLAGQHNDEGYLPRRSRLFGAILRLTIRHNGFRKLIGLRAMGIVPMTARGLL